MTRFGYASVKGSGYWVLAALVAASALMLLAACGGGGGVQASGGEADHSAGPTTRSARTAVSRRSTSTAEAHTESTAATSTAAHGEAAPTEDEGHGTATEETDAHGATADSGDAEEADAGHGAVHWGYSALDGPDLWASLSADYEKCGSGVEQSPVNIQTAMTHGVDGSVFLNYGDTALTITNNGHTI